MTKEFRVITGQSSLPRAVRDRWPRAIPWSFAETFRAQAEANHDQTLERLHERGGLAPEEIWRAAHGQRLFRTTVDVPNELECGLWLIAKVAELAAPEPTVEQLRAIYAATLAWRACYPEVVGPGYGALQCERDLIAAIDAARKAT